MFKFYSLHAYWWDELEKQINEIVGKGNVKDVKYANAFEYKENYRCLLLVEYDDGNKIEMLKNNLKEAERALEISQEEFWKLKDENKGLRKQIQDLENELSKSNENNEEVEL